jgi:hypothetical protein
MENWINIKIWIFMMALQALVEFDKSRKNSEYFNENGILTIVLTIGVSGFFWAVVVTFLYKKFKK